MNKLKSKAFKIRFFNPHPELQRRQYTFHAILSLADNTERLRKSTKKDKQQEKSDFASTYGEGLILSSFVSVPCTGQISPHPV